MQTEQDIQLIINTIGHYSDYDFSEYSIKSFTRRIEKILIDYKVDLQKLLKIIKTDKLTLEQIVRDITVNTTELFRDPKIWQALRYRVLPFFNNYEEINIWHAGCSTGQEVYSMLILLKELGLYDKTNVFASDINTSVLKSAKKGEYVYRFNLDYLDNFDKVIRQNPYNFDEHKEIPYSKYFKIDKIKDTIKINSFLREKPLYLKHDLVKDGNVFNKQFDLIMCRNVLIYFNYELQNKIFDLFYDMLHRKGILFLGIHESILGAKASKYFKKGLYYKKKQLF